MTESGIIHSSDYRSIQWRGETYGLTERQAQVVHLLDEAYMNGTPDLAQKTPSEIPRHFGARTG